jgi:hypothetical protein
MRRTIKIKKVCINAHPNLYNKMEEIRKMYIQQSGISLSQMQLTNIIAQRIKPINNINILGDKNVKTKKKSRPY